MPEAICGRESAGKLLTEFDCYLTEVRGLSPGTRRAYRRHVREFLDTRFPSGIITATEISARYLYCYASEHASRGKPGSSKTAITALRSLIGYLAIRGDCSLSLASAVPSVPHWRRSILPRVLSEQQVATLLASFDRAKPIGLRDYAIALCLARLGLRAGEVARLSLDDINWRAASLSIHGEKSRRVSVLPLLEEVGNALVDYVSNARPATSERRIFVSHARGPQEGRPVEGGAIGQVIRRAIERSGIHVTHAGPHTLRHTLCQSHAWLRIQPEANCRYPTSP